MEELFGLDFELLPRRSGRTFETSSASIEAYGDGGKYIGCP
jgi:hypothetical protein